jgi:hypothetical protein
MIDKLKSKVPCDTVAFLPTFMTSTPDSRLAFHAAFCDLVSPYFEYGTKLCALPIVRIAGGLEDWTKVCDHFRLLSHIFAKFKVLAEYLYQCESTTRAIVNTIRGVIVNPVAHFQSMAIFARCGSGSDHEMKGWILNYLLNKGPKIQTNCLPVHTSIVNWTNLDTGRKFRLFAGLFHSNIQDDFAVPTYGHAVSEVKFEKIVGEPWEVKRYAKGSIVYIHGWNYRALVDTEEVPYRSQQWARHSQGKPDKVHLELHSSPITPKVNELKPGWKRE